MGAGGVRGNSDGGEGRGGDRPHPLLQEGDHASRYGDARQDRDHADGESPVTFDHLVSGTVVADSTASFWVAIPHEVIAAIAEDYPLLGQFLGHVAIIPKIDHPQLTRSEEHTSELQSQSNLV